MQPFLLRVVAAIRSLAQEPQQRFALLYGAGARVVRGVYNFAKSKKQKVESSESAGREKRRERHSRSLQMAIAQGARRKPLKNSKNFLKLASASAAFCANGEHASSLKKIRKKRSRGRSLIGCECIEPLGESVGGNIPSQVPRRYPPMCTLHRRGTSGGSSTQLQSSVLAPRNTCLLIPHKISNILGGNNGQ